MNWIATTERMPPVRERLFFFDARVDEIRIGDWREDGCFWRTGDGWEERTRSEYVTHWHPIELPVLSPEERDRIDRIARVEARKGGAL